MTVSEKKSTLSNFPFYKILKEDDVYVLEAYSNSTILVDELKNCTISMEDGAGLTFIYVGNQGWEDLVKIKFELVGKNCELLFLGMIVGTAHERFPFETISRHLVPQTKAHYFVRSAMFDHSFVDYKGNIIIEKKAQLADSYLAHSTLLLSEYARAKSVPALEIEADDVKAGHAATIGKVDEEVMFYLTSRGINEKEAELMLIEGFFEPELAMIEDQDLREKLRTHLEKLLPIQTIF